jgi:hypothetical protein
MKKKLLHDISANTLQVIINQLCGLVIFYILSAQLTKNDFGEINWDEFWNVVKGNGPCNKQRLAARNKAHDEGAWVREAAIAYAEKKKQIKIQAA